MCVCAQGRIHRGRWRRSPPVAANFLNPVLEFSVIFCLLSKAHIEISCFSMPIRWFRRPTYTECNMSAYCRKLINRTNSPAATPTEFYRRTIYLPLLYAVSHTDMRSHISDETLSNFNDLAYFIPAVIAQSTEVPVQLGTEVLPCETKNATFIILPPQQLQKLTFKFIELFCLM